MSPPDTTAPPPLDQAFVETLLAALIREGILTPPLARQMRDQLAQRLTTPRSGEIDSPQVTSRLELENQALLSAFQLALRAVPRERLPQPVAHWLAGAARDGAADSPDILQGVMSQLEAQLGDAQLSQVYAGVINFLDPKFQRGQTLPVNWEGLRFRILAAAEGDLTPRGHLNYFCSYAARVIELLSEKGFRRATLRQQVAGVIRQGRQAVGDRRQARITARFQEILGDIQEILMTIHTLAEGILQNLRMAKAVQESQDAHQLATTIQRFQTRHTRLKNTLKEIERSGIPLPQGLKDGLGAVIQESRAILGDQPALEDPSRLQRFLERVKGLRQKAKGVTREFRHIRRKSRILAHRASAGLGREQETGPMVGIRQVKERALLAAARELLWSLEELEGAVELEEAGHDAALMRVKAAVLNRVPRQPAVAGMEKERQRRPLDRMGFRAAGKTLLAALFPLLEPAPTALLEQHEEHPLWGAVAELADAHLRFSRLVEGEEHRQLEELPQVLMRLQGELQRLGHPTDPRHDVQPALRREAHCRSGQLRLPLQQRVAGLFTPLLGLTRHSLTVRDDDPALRATRERAFSALGVTREPEPERSRNYLAELTVVPIAGLFTPQDPRYGRSRSALERRLLHAPVAGLLPAAVLFGVRKENSLADLGNPEEARERSRQARELFNRSGLVGEVLGLHPSWPRILASDAAQSLARELRPLFAGRAGQGFLARLVADNEEYHELTRLGEEESREEVGLLREGLTSWDGFHGLEMVLTLLLQRLADPALAAALKPHGPQFLRRQREILGELNIHDPLEHLLPASDFAEEQQRAPLHRMLETLTDRERELCLLQLLHRQFLQPEVLVLLVKDRYPTPRDLADELPQLERELRERYLWQRLHNPPGGERQAARELLEGVGLGEWAEALDQWLAGDEDPAQLVAVLAQLRQRRPTSWGGQLMAALSGQGEALRQAERAWRHLGQEMTSLGLGRELALLARQLP